MEKLTKGLKAKNEIVTRATEVFNRRGINTTLNELAGEMDQSISYICNHFRTKDHLFVAIAQRYEDELQELLQTFGMAGGFDLTIMVRHFSAVMDLQYAYRSAIIAVFSSSNTQKVLFHQVTRSFNTSRKNIRQFAEVLVATGYMRANVLEPQTFDVFKFQFVNLFMAWLVNLELFDYEAGFDAMKPVYLEGLVNILLPHMTEKGQAEYHCLDFVDLAKNPLI
jgi:AcrR family transcriptional regulator